MASGLDCKSSNCTITNCWACYYSFNMLPFPQLPHSCPQECENPLDERCMRTWGRCVHRTFLRAYNMVCNMIKSLIYIHSYCGLFNCVDSTSRCWSKHLSLLEPQTLC